MIIVGLTGGIGSGKTTVAHYFSELGIPIYLADTEAKKLMTADERLKADIVALLGSAAYQDGVLNRGFIAGKVFKSKQLLDSLNKIVHPAVANHFKLWVQNQNAPYVIKEAAILFENGGYLNCDFTILVTAPRGERIKRVMKRDHTSENEVISRMNAQWTDARKTALADVKIENIDFKESKRAAARIHRHLMIRIHRGWI